MQRRQKLKLSRQKYDKTHNVKTTLLITRIRSRGELLPFKQLVTVGEHQGVRVQEHALGSTKYSRLDSPSPPRKKSKSKGAHIFWSRFSLKSLSASHYLQR